MSQLLDLYRLWPNWWEGYAPGDYFAVELKQKTPEIDFSLDSWYVSGGV